MKRIFRHIEYLLLEHDHLIIPQLGGFVANDMPSVWSEEEELFLPPYRTVHFNASLNHGDNTLVDSLAQAYSVPPAEAEKWCAQFVQSIHMELAENGSLDFGSIGVMMQESPEQTITFSPCKAGVTTPDFYGLDAFHMPLLEENFLQKQKEKNSFLQNIRHTAKRKETEDSTQHYTLRINRHLAHAVTTLAASIILFILFTPALNKPMMMGTQSSKAELFIPSHLLNQLETTADRLPINIMVKEEPLNEITSRENSTSSDITNSKPKSKENSNIKQEKIEFKHKSIHKTSKKVSLELETPPPFTPTTQKGMAIVLASAISIQNAETYARNLQSRGYDAHVYQNGKMVRVIIPCYDGEKKTRENLRQMKLKDTEFKQAWITTLE